MKVVVTGGTGYIGTVLCELLLGQGHEVAALDSLRNNRFSGLSYLDMDHGDENFMFDRVDLVKDSGPRIARWLNWADVLVHLAAIVGDPECKEHPDEARDTNIGAVVRLSGMCAERDIPIVAASTCSVYGASGGAIHADEYDPVFVAPVSFYAWTKVCMEQILLSCNPGATILRFATAFGRSPMMRWDLTVNEFVKTLMCEDELEVYDKDTWRPYAHVQDIARSLAFFVSNRHGGIFNVGDSSMNFTKKQLASTILDLVPDGRSPVVRWVDKLGSDPRNYKVSFKRLRDLQPEPIQYNLVRGVSEMIGMFGGPR